MNVDDFLRFFPDVKLTDEQLACCHYLQREGKRFCVDFGYQNAPDMVWDAMDREVESMEMPR